MNRLALMEASPEHSAPSTPASRRPSKKASAATFDLNVTSVVLGDRLIKPWYPSLYREELMGSEPVERLFVCERCFKYTKEATSHVAHMRFCRDAELPPGRVVYAKDKYTLYEVDGEEHRLFAQNLSLFSKFFIETKSVCFDVTTFLYYLLLLDINETSEGGDDERKSQVVGFFSKEKLSWDNNNLACILVFPPWQKQGLGQLMMGASYELSRRDGKLGGPERPLSGPGAQSYQVYWCRAVAQAILTRPANKAVTINDITEQTCMIPEDVVGTLLHMGVLGSKKKDGSIKLDRADIRAWLAENKIDLASPVDPDGFVESVDQSGNDDGEEDMEE